MKKKLLTIWLLCVTTAWVALGAPPPSFKSVPGYMTRNWCDPFSKAAVAMLHERGVPAVRITYGWSAFGAGSGYHAAVLFKWGGKFYFMDNWRQGPRLVAGETDLGCVRRINGEPTTWVWMVSEDKQRTGPRKLNELFPD